MKPGMWPNCALYIVSAMVLLLFTGGVAGATTQSSDLVNARDRGDGPALDVLIQYARENAEANPNSAEAQYQLALAYSYGAEVAMEQHDKKKSESLAEAGLEVAKKTVSEASSNAEYHRLLGAL